MECQTPEPIPIAIIGLSFRAPGSVRTEDDFWEFCCRAKSAWSEIPTERFTSDAYYSNNPDKTGSFPAKGGYFLQDDVRCFDASFFNITAEEAKAMDPQHRLSLECAYEALEQAGETRRSLANERVGVFAAGTNSDYEVKNSLDPDQIPRASITGQAPCMLANRISYFFDFRGPSMTVDTACSSSLTALHVACQSLKHGESSHALVTGCHLNLIPQCFISFASSSLLGPSGKCHSFDTMASSGYGRGEGAGCLYLRPLDAAVAAGDNIRAVIVNTGVNQDGHTPGISMPSSRAQEQLIQSVYRSAAIDPKMTAYVEAHGTGTKVGDPIEAEALYRCFGKQRTPETPLFVGSLKSNFGHAEGTSGMLSVIKTVFMLERGYILPTGGDFKQPREDIPWRAWNLKVPTKLIQWPTDKPYASINNFGLGGANAHAILCRSPDPSSSRTRKAGSRDLRQNQAISRVYILSGNSEHAVKMQAKGLRNYLDVEESVDDSRLMYNLAYTLGQRRNMLPWKVALPATSIQDLRSGLVDEECIPSKADTQPSVAFVFTGQGAQWYAMGRELIDVYPGFRSTLQRVDEELARAGAPFSVTDEIRKNEHCSQIDNSIISQAACTGIQIALVELLRSWDIQPSAVIGHSSGEIAAAYTAGILSLQSAILIAYHRGVAAGELLNCRHIKGAMVAVGAPVQEVERLLGQVQNGEASIACINSGQNVTVSGDEHAVQELENIVASLGLFHRRLRVNVAYHSKHTHLVADQYLESLRTIQTHDATIPFYSATRETQLPSYELQGPYWVENFVSCVRFAPALRNMLDSEAAGGKRITTLIEVGPHPALASSISEILRSSGHSQDTGYLSTLRRRTSAISSMQALLIQLILKGQDVCWETVNPMGPEKGTPSLLTNLPSYPWDHSVQYDHQTHITQNHLFKPFPRHDLLGSLTVESNPTESRWRAIIRQEEHPWIRDHRIQGRAVFPMAAFISMATEAARMYATRMNIEFDTFKIREVQVSNMLVIPKSSAVELTLSLRRRPHGTMVSSSTWHEVVILSSSDNKTPDENFRCLVSMQIMRKPNPVSNQNDRINAALMEALASMESSCTEEAQIDAFYGDLEDNRFQYDRLFRGLTRCFTNQVEGRSTIVTPKLDEHASDVPDARMSLHPAILDLCLQTSFLTLGGGTKGVGTTYVPNYVKEITIDRTLHIKQGDIFHSYAKRTSPKFYDRPVSMNLSVISEKASDVPVICIQGLSTVPVGQQSSLVQTSSKRDICYKTDMVLCLDLTPLKELELFCSPVRDRDTADIENLERIAAFYVRKAMESVSTKTSRSTSTLGAMLSLLSRTGYATSDRVSPALDWFYQWMLEINSTRCSEYLQSSARDSIDEARGLPSSTALIKKIGPELPDILRGEINLAQLSQRYGGLDKYYADRPFCHPSYQRAGACIKVMVNQKPNLRILEIGSSLESTVQILGCLSERVQTYTFMSAGEPVVQDKECVLGEWSSHVQVEPIGIMDKAKRQYPQSHSFDLIIVSNLGQGSTSVMDILSCARGLLKSNGKLMIVEENGQQPFHFRDFPVLLLRGLPPPKQISADHRDVPTTDEWNILLEENGFSQIRTLFEIPSDQAHQGGRVILSSQQPECALLGRKVVVVHNNDLERSWLVSLSEAIMRATGTEPLIQSLQEADTGDNLCLFLGELTNPMLAKMNVDAFTAVKRLVANSSGMLWVTHDAYIDSKKPEANLVSGLSRTIRSELGLAFATLDFDGPALSNGANYAADLMVSILEIVFGQTSALCDGDFEFTVRNNSVLVPRVLPDHALNDSLNRLSSGPVGSTQPVSQDHDTLRLAIQDYGMLDSLHFAYEAPSTSPLSADHVEIEVKCVGLNFRDIMHANNQIPVDGFGIECSGTVIAVGSRVTDVEVGDRVCALADCCFSTRTQCPAACVKKVDDTMSFEVAASIPAVFTTAIHSLLFIAHLEANETVLIHAAAGGVGQAAIMVAQATGATVFATVGSLRKKKFLMETYGIPESHIFYSRDQSFVGEVMASTHGVGVDVVLNSLAGDSLQASLQCVAPFGRFVEIGKKDIAMNMYLEMSQFAHNISFSAVDLSTFGRERPQQMRKLLRETFRLLQSGEIRPVSPLNTFDASEVPSAFQLLQSGHSIGKVIVRLNDLGGDNVIQFSPNTCFLEADATYLIVGGTGGLGRSITQWLATHGAKHVLLVSRSGPGSPGVEHLINSMSSQGVQVCALSCDVTDKTQLMSILRPHLQQCSPLRGVIHSAMVLKDAMFNNSTLSDFESVLKPKVDAVYAVNELLIQLGYDLDFFIALSSISGIIGNQGQSSYAAASTFLDAFSEYNHLKNRPFTSIDLAPLWDIGYLAEHPEKRRLVREQIGKDGMVEAELHDILTAVASPSAKTFRNSQILTGMNININDPPLWAKDARFSHLLGLSHQEPSQSDSQSAGEALKRVQHMDEALRIITDTLVEKVSTMTITPVNQIDASVSVLVYSLDSLSASELRRWISREFEASLEAFDILTSSSLVELAKVILTCSELVPKEHKVKWALL
ncbi:fatty acid synthase S-acetyltransferase [Aspergillus sergii]|uniref:Fatty acid synthase S-acetyltransferase n=1 Tax=Aspergillus sergii TaxID=1034303 RepID=A0A5N6WTD4_9EURO|nr:fatty acid synthase S-acetyltransferase [Aspergillus sergii]